MNTRTLTTVSLALALLALPLAAVTINFSSYTDTNYFRVIRDDGTPINNITWSSALGPDGNAGLLDDVSYTDDGLAVWLYDANGYAGGSNVYGEGNCELDTYQTQISQPMQLLFAPTPQNAITLSFQIRSGDQRVDIFTNVNETTDYSAGAVRVLQKYYYKSSLKTQQWNKVRLVVGNEVAGSDKYRWVRLEVFDNAIGGVKQIELAWTNSIANQYADAGEFGFDKSRTYGSPVGQVYMFDNFGVIPEPAAGLALLLGALLLRRVR
ncbi:MAG: hypothetical protein NTV22_01800 [bacterium]|nr:hypothetical protein [bacterium]